MHSADFIWQWRRAHKREWMYYSLLLTAYEVKAARHGTRNTHLSYLFWESSVFMFEKLSGFLICCPARHSTSSKPMPQTCSPVGKKTEHYQKFLTKHFLEQNSAARIVKLKGTVSFKSSCTSPGSFCNLGNTVFKRNWVMVMAEEHGMYKGSAPGEGARGGKNNGGRLRPGAALRCFASAVTEKS